MIPVLYLLDAFDSKNQQQIRFKWNGAQSFGNSCIIRENVSNNIVYQATQTTMQLAHTIPANTLTNGKLYNARIASIDVNGNISDYSNPILFYCYTTPTFELSNITYNQVIKNSSYQLQLNYSQPENEYLKTFEIGLYDLSRSIIKSSGMLYFGMNDLFYELHDLEDNQSYYVKATGITTNGMYIETDYIYFSVNYEQPAAFSILTLENVSNSGYIKLQSNIKTIKCYTGKEPIFLYDEYIDLRDDVLGINDGFSFDNDFVINCSGYGFSEGLIMQLFDGTNIINVYYRKGTYDVNNGLEKVFIELNVPVSFTKYCCFSNYIDVPSDTDELSIWIKRENGLFSISIKGR
jgi:hypothetical protein